MVCVCVWGGGGQVVGILGEAGGRRGWEGRDGASGCWLHKCDRCDNFIASG